jgi:hypothetical protein
VTDHIATANAIKAEIRACQTAQEVHGVASKHRATGVAMKAAGGDAETLAGHIGALIKRRLVEIKCATE